MKIRSVAVQHFKRFQDYQLDLLDPLSQRPRELHLLIGENGSGKTTLLQAIALPLAVATRARAIQQPDAFSWPGFMLDRIDPLVAKIEIDVQFDPDELDMTWRLSEELRRLGRFDRTAYIAPGKNPCVKLFYENGQVRCSSREEFYQFRGREYARQLVKQCGYEAFDHVGSVFWYDQERRATSLSPDSEQAKTDISRLRMELSRLQTIHSNKLGAATNARDLYAEFDVAYRKAFYPRRLEGVRLKPGVDIERGGDDFWFMLSDGDQSYELDEMSSGERALFPILFDFVKWRINRSIVLVDELELHLHPPLQQHLIHLLPTLGRDNQFILTTHSDDVLNVVPKDAVHRVEARP